MTPDPGRAALLRFYSQCVRRRMRAEQLLARRVAVEQDALAQLAAWDADAAADRLAGMRERLDETLERRRQAAAERQGRVDAYLARKAAA